jgi:hypothetical protein
MLTTDPVMSCVLENTGITWTFESGDNYFLRDDMLCALCNYERYSLFRTGSNYRRIDDFCTLDSGLDSALPFFHKAVRTDRRMRGLPFVDPTTVFLDKRGQP